MQFLINYAVEIALTILSSGFIYLMGKIKKQVKNLIATQKGVESLLKARIIEKYNDYKEKGKISLYDKEAIEGIYIEYKNLGGNGIIDKLMKEILEIPITKCEEGDN